MKSKYLKSMKYDLEERTSAFAEEILEIAAKVPQNVITVSIISQLVRAATSIGANYYEANGASSRKDFKNKIHICKKEAKETGYWLRMLKKVCPNFEEEIDLPAKEANELLLIFSKIALSSK